MDTVVLVAETRDGSPIGHVLEMCAAARKLASGVTAVVWGEGAAAAAPFLGAHGVTRVCDVGDIGDALPPPRVAAAIAGEIDRGGVDAVFAAATYDGRDIAARLSARIDRPVITNVVGLELEGDSLVSSHSVFGGSQLVRARFTGAGPAIFVLRAKSFASEEVGGPPPEVASASIGELAETDAARIVARHAESRSGPSLDDAKVVVSGGRGLGAPEHYALIEELARLLGGAPGASRAIVDAGWVPYAYQVGQTGKTVKPSVYLAFGISGATQHLVGMKGADHIVAVNKDPAAPILAIADLGVVGDVHQVLPKLVEAIKAKS
ncbi:MAG: etfA [Acidimicrobiaceae bacterium]|jgi:electron transfer flavoprotein alpha subunit|nr:etfA [Acidimicrobiaceae bacterium]